MKVLEKGRPQKGWAKEFVCSGKGNNDGGCGAKLLVEFDDLFRTFHTDYGGGKDVFVTFKCMDCGVLTDIDPKHWPSTTDMPDKDLWERREIAKSVGVLHG
jgi:hypothetical protein